MAIGAESTGWMMQVDSETIIDGKPISSIEVSDVRKPKQLEEFENKRVKIAGKVLYRNQRGDRGPAVHRDHDHQSVYRPRQTLNEADGQGLDPKGKKAFPLGVNADPSSLWSYAPIDKIVRG